MDITLNALSALIISIGVIGGAIIWVYKKIISPTITKITVIHRIIEREMVSNGGNSIFDKLNEINNKLEAHLVIAEISITKLDEHVADSNIHKE